MATVRENIELIATALHELLGGRQAAGLIPLTDRREIVQRIVSQALALGTHPAALEQLLFMLEEAIQNAREQFPGG